MRNFSIDQLSFWIGFLSGLLFFWFFYKFRPILDRLWREIGKFASQTRQGLSAGTEHHYRMDLLRFAQRHHLTAPLFSLDEIIIEPRVLAPPAIFSPDKKQNFSDIAAEVIPYLPDWPELGSNYGAPTLTLINALQGGANLILLGRPGIGKTVALAHLASQISRQSPNLGELSHFLPVLIDTADLNLQNSEQTEPAEILIEAVISKASTITRPRLPGLLRQQLANGSILLLLDGLDELPPKLVDRITGFLENLLKANPEIRTIVTASPQYFDGLTKLGFVPIPMASWGFRQREWFLQNWSDLWQRHIAPKEGTKGNDVDQRILIGWLLQENTSLTPLELTLKVWAAFAGDALGPGANDALEAYIRRSIANSSEERSGLEDLALSTITTKQPILRPNEVKYLSGDFDNSDFLHDQRSDTAKKGTPETTAVPKSLSGLVETGLLVEYANSHLKFNHIVISGFLAAQALSKTGNYSPLVNHPEWAGKLSALQFLSAETDITSLANSYLNKESDPLASGPLTIARWLQDAPKNASWRAKTMRILASMLHDENLALALRARILTALAISNEPGVSTLFKKLAASEEDTIRLIGVLGCGLCLDGRTVNELQNLLADPTPKIRQAACLALVAIGTIPALETVASALLHGEEDVRRAAAESLANHPEEGHPILQDGVSVDDLLVRRAVVYGLAKVRQPWAIQMLEKMQVQDGQWVVRNAANQALEEISRPNPLIPRPKPPLSETPWLIAFAGEYGVGISPGKSTENLLIKALKEGKQDQRLAALDRLAFLASPDTVPAIYQALFTHRGEVREAAHNTLWHMAAAGVDLPPPQIVDTLSSSNT